MSLKGWEARAASFGDAPPCRVRESPDLPRTLMFAGGPVSYDVPIYVYAESRARDDALQAVRKYLK